MSFAPNTNHQIFPKAWYGESMLRALPNRRMLLSFRRR